MTGKNLVIDTCICQSSGGMSATECMSIICTNFLDNVYDLNYHFVCTDEINDEISRHINKKELSYHAVAWLAKMRKRNRIHKPGEITVNQVWRSDIRSADISDGKKAEMLKDIHLIEAANITDKKIISLDKEAYAFFKDMGKKDQIIGKLVWMDITNNEIDINKWLKSGAKIHKKYMLGYNRQN